MNSSSLLIGLCPLTLTLPMNRPPLPGPLPPGCGGRGRRSARMHGAALNGKDGYKVELLATALQILFLLFLPVVLRADAQATSGSPTPENSPLNAPSSSGVIIGAGETWRCLRTAPDGAGLPANWNTPEFDDSGWNSVITGTSYAPDEDAAFALTATERRSGWIFLRKSFAVEPAAAIRWLILRVEHDGPFRAWLNGMDVTDPAQVKTDRGPNTYESSLLPRFTMTQVDLTPHLRFLKPGTNVLAVVADWRPSRDLVVVATPVLLANFTRGPFLQSNTPTGVSIVWRTPLPTTTRVEYGPTPALGKTWQDEVPSTNHIVTLTGLTADSLYYYRVGGADAGGSVASGVEPFRTFKLQGALTFMVVGDTGMGTPAQGVIAGVIRDAHPDFVMHDGDIIYRGFSDARADDRVFHYYQRQMRSVPWFFAVGNHDFNCCVGQPDFNLDNWQLHATHYQNVFHLPTNAVTGTCHFYSFDQGDAHFSVLHHPWFSHYVFNAHKEQYHWLTNDLARSDKPWKILVLHSPIAHSGAHGLDDRNLDGVPDQHEMMSLLLPLTQRYGVQAVFAGHDHNYERFVPTNGLHHVVTGGGGGALYAFVARHPGSAQFWKTYHCLKVRVQGETLLCEALGVKGEVFDSFSITKSVPARQVWPSAWHTPLWALGPANDGDGNIEGQVFDFAGEPIPALAGQFSNLGRCFVNNDATHLYVGFKQAAFYGNNNVFLFLESPRLPGVRALAGLGNGRVDPRGEGADGLDFLKNLSFTNFSPSVACLLGDEMADGQYRSFARPGLGLNIGQGVFHLDKTFSDVPGTRLQQFNRSPQTYSVPLHANGADAEQNADFIEVAIPFSALGGVRPGDVVKVGAVVGGGGVNLQTRRRQLDSGFLGAALTGQGMGPVVLEGVSVRLAAPETPAP